MKAKRLVLFDFDGTLTEKDTFFEFISFTHGRLRLLLGLVMLSPLLLLFKVGLIKNQFAKEQVLTYFYKGISITEFNKLCSQFARDYIPKLIRSNALLLLNEYIKEESTTIIVVSASPENWVSEWCKQHGIHCISTRLLVGENLITGKIDGLNCYGMEKVRRVKETTDISEYAEIIAYGDSRGDKEMLALASKPHYRFF